MQKIILASQSPRRKMLLEWAEVPFQVIVKHTEENFPAGMLPEEAAVYVARQKALAVKADASKDYEGRLDETHHLPILAADTMVVLDNEIIGKPANRKEAIEILSKLSGATHRVITGVSIISGQNHVEFADITEVMFHPISEEDIAYYVDNYEPYDKAGAYAIQEWIGVVGIKSVRGDFYNVMGLPVSRVLMELRRLQ
jgi:septum formation protein